MFQKKISYFKLKDSKRFSNGNTIDSGALIVKTSLKDQGKFLYHTLEEEQIIWFYANDEEVEFVEEKVQEIPYYDIESKIRMIDSWL